MAKKDNEKKQEKELSKLILQLAVYSGMIHMWETLVMESNNKVTIPEFIRICNTKQETFLPSTTDKDINNLSDEIITEIIEKLTEWYNEDKNDESIPEYFFRNMQLVHDKIEKFPSNNLKKKIKFKKFKKNNKKSEIEEKFNRSSDSSYEENSDGDSSYEENSDGDSSYEEDSDGGDSSYEENSDEDSRGEDSDKLEIVLSYNRGKKRKLSSSDLDENEIKKQPDKKQPDKKQPDKKQPDKKQPDKKQHIDLTKKLQNKKKMRFSVNNEISNISTVVTSVNGCKVKIQAAISPGRGDISVSGTQQDIWTACNCGKALAWNTLDREMKEKWISKWLEIGLGDTIHIHFIGLDIASTNNNLDLDYLILPVALAIYGVYIQETISSDNCVIGMVDLAGNMSSEFNISIPICECKNLFAPEKFNDSENYKLTTCKNFSDIVNILF